jgi:hypothetical protein
MTPEDIERQLREDVAEFTQPQSPRARAIEEQLRRDVNEFFTCAGWSTPFAAPRRRPQVQPLDQPSSQQPESKPPRIRW